MQEEIIQICKPMWESKDLKFIDIRKNPRQLKTMWDFSRKIKYESYDLILRKNDGTKITINFPMGCNIEPTMEEGLKEHQI